MNDSSSDTTRADVETQHNMSDGHMKEHQPHHCVRASPDSPGHSLPPSDPDSPMAWPMGKRIYTSAVAFFYAFVVVYGTTTYVVAIPDVVKGYDTTLHLAILGFTLPFFGVAAAPLYTPHLSERWGRRPIYWTAIPLFMLCVVVIGLAPNISTLLAFRFLAGLFGGPTLVLIEGTFADIWSAERTVTYYAFLAPASYLGGAFGPIIGGYVLANKGAPWLAWVTLLFAAASMAFGAFMPETYAREILRTRIHYKQQHITLPCAESGTTLVQMAHITLLHPLRMIVSEPLVIMCALYLGVVFAVVFQFFVAVPTVLHLLYGFDLQRQGLAFLSAVGGIFLGNISCVLLEHFTINTKRGKKYPVEDRLLPAMIGSLLSAGALFWVAYTAKPTVHYVVPIIATGVYVWGNIMSLTSFISYLFDAYPPAGTLSALTACASFRLICAGVVPIFIINMITNLGGKWTYIIFGIISAVMHFIPDILYMFGARIRERSSYSKNGISTLQAEVFARHPDHPAMEGITMPAPGMNLSGVAMP